jgi:hypothetical protein
MKTALLFLSVLSCFICSFPVSARHLQGRSRIDQYFASANPDEKLAFLIAMPKGADLDMELAGSAYAETIMASVAKKGGCLDNTLALQPPSCKEDQIPARNLLTDPELYRHMLDAWSFPESQGTDRERFFRTLGKFATATHGMTGEILANMASSAAREHVMYLEVEIEPDDGVRALGKRIGWDDNYQNTLHNLQNNGISRLAKSSTDVIRMIEAEKNGRLHCGMQDADPGCRVAIGYLYGIDRANSPGEVFAQLEVGLELASMPNSGFSGILLKGAEDQTLKDFNLHMQMLDYLKTLHPKAHVAVNAGELTPELATPKNLSFHVSEAVMLGHAQRIGAGSDIMYEVPDLPGKLAKMKVLVDICPSRIRAVLGDNADPLRLYLKHGVPVAISSCDGGLLRSELPSEYLKASLDDDLTYANLKRIARDSLERSFLPGRSLWRNAERFSPVRQCERDVMVGRLLTSFCQDYLNANRKAKLEWQLESELKAFERRY